MSSSIVAMSSGSSVLLSGSNLGSSAAQFREIHKNTWLKRLTSDGKKITVGPKKSERSWVVFCVHDDTEALLEGYAEPRQAASHSPEWMVSMQDTLHISHALIPNSQEFEFVITLSNEVVRFHAMSWEIMQEWVETLRSKLREMKILSPRENLYTKLPEVRAPLLPTRDPTSPLPAPPPVPAALVPGVERVIPHSQFQGSSMNATETRPETQQVSIASTSCVASITSAVTSSTVITAISSVTSATTSSMLPHSTPILSAMSNTLTQNLLNMLSDPISAYSEQLSVEAEAATARSIDTHMAIAGHDEQMESCSESNLDLSDNSDALSSPLLRKFSQIVTGRVKQDELSLENNVRVDVAPGSRSSADQMKNLENLLQCERLIPRPQTTRSLSAGAADNSRKQKSSNISSDASQSKTEITTAAASSFKNNNTTAMEKCVDTFKVANATNANVNNGTSSPNNSNASNNHKTAADPKTNITIIQVSNNTDNVPNEAVLLPPKLPVKNVTAEVFKFPDTMSSPTASTKLKQLRQHEYKSNVQIIPSNVNSSTIQVISDQHSISGSNTTTNKCNQYSSPVKKPVHANTSNGIVTNSTTPCGTTHPQAESSSGENQQQQITKVHVSGDVGVAVAIGSDMSGYGTCYTMAHSADSPSSLSTPKLRKKIILSANTSGVTNIAVNNASNNSLKEQEDVIGKPKSTGSSVNSYVATTATTSATGDISVNVHYEKIFLSSSIPISVAVPASVISTGSTPTSLSLPEMHAQRKSPRALSDNATESSKATPLVVSVAKSALSASPSLTSGSNVKSQSPSVSSQCHVTASSRNKSVPLITACTTSTALLRGGSPALQRRRKESPSNLQNSLPGGTVIVTGQPALSSHPPLLKRGLTEAVITTRPSRKDFNFLNFTPAKSKAQNGIKMEPKSTATSNNNVEITNAAAVSNSVSAPPQAPQHAVVSRANSESLEQRRRSSSTSDAHARGTRGANNNELPSSRTGSNSALRIQQPPQPFRSVENSVTGGFSPPTSTANSPAAKRVTLREQQVMQLRREIMHPGGVRLQLRRKDCVGSIAWVDAFNAVWVAGWKQKEHPVLYNALHIGDQLISIAGAAISTATEANKIIRNANTLFVEVLVRRLPFGRGYAIRREREGQCLGLIRDGNTATIVDVVPNSLAARHGLPPKAQSCDGTTLTFWVLTEINGRPLNVFFKENEIRDRLNSLGRDISILVQPSDLITKLKKQLKSLRGYKDYLVQ